jgi:phytoene synthase
MKHPSAGSLAGAYEQCVWITRTQATNFYFGIRLLPRVRREALCAVYSLCRRIDDIGDSGLPQPEAARRLASERRKVRALATGEKPAEEDPLYHALADSVMRFPIPVEAFGDLIDGVEMDLRGERYETFEDLVVYCRRVAGAIGRLSLGTMRVRERRCAVPLADDLGVALQITNILRDIREDADNGRVYLPAEDAAAFGLTPELEGPADALKALVRFEVARAEGWFERGVNLLSLLDRPGAACVGTMAGIYRRLLKRIALHPESVLAGRTSLPGWEKGWVAARSLAGRTP